GCAEVIEDAMRLVEVFRRYQHHAEPLSDLHNLLNWYGIDDLDYGFARAEAGLVGRRNAAVLLRVEGAAEAGNGRRTVVGLGAAVSIPVIATVAARRGAAGCEVDQDRRVVVGVGRRRRDLLVQWRHEDECQACIGRCIRWWWLRRLWWQLDLEGRARLAVGDRPHAVGGEVPAAITRLLPGLGSGQTGPIERSLICPEPGRLRCHLAVPGGRGDDPSVEPYQTAYRGAWSAHSSSSIGLVNRACRIPSNETATEAARARVHRPQRERLGD